MSAARGSLLGIEHLDAAEILKILKFARRMNPDKPRPLLKSKRVFLLFYESSTRTRSSFEIAAKGLGAHTVLIQAAGSSIEKGESLLDTGYTVRALGADVIVIRHPNAGAPRWPSIDVPVMCGDGLHEHPSQALLDAYTRSCAIRRSLQVAIIGHFHSRVARSACHLLNRFGLKIILLRAARTGAGDRVRWRRGARDRTYRRCAAWYGCGDALRMQARMKIDLPGTSLATRPARLKTAKKDAIV